MFSHHWNDATQFNEVFSSCYNVPSVESIYDIQQDLKEMVVRRTESRVYLDAISEGQFNVGSDFNEGEPVGFMGWSKFNGIFTKRKFKRNIMHKIRYFGRR